MKYIFKILIILLILGCSPSNSLINKEPYLYTLENSDGTKTLVPSHKKSSISKTNFQNLKEYLVDINDYNLDFNKKIILNFIDNDPIRYRKNYQVPWDIFYGNLYEELNSIEPCNQIWILNKSVKDLYYYHGNKINWIVDRDNVIRELFFNYNGLNGGFVIIKPNGKYFLKVGEYKKSDVLNTLKGF